MKLYLFCFKILSHFCIHILSFMSATAKAYLALIFICIVWGTTYMAIRVGVEYYPAFLFAGTRQLISGLILLLVAYATNKKFDLSAANIMRQLVIGFLMLTLGNGLVTWGERTVPSGAAALICSAMPIFAVLFGLLQSNTHKINATIGGGMLLGTLGVALIFRQDVAALTNGKYILGILAIVMATASWAGGSVYNRKNINPVNPLFNAALQLTFGGLVMLVISATTESYEHLTLIHSKGLLSLIYLIVFGSVLAYSAYMYALQHLPVGIATIYAYINPLVAVLMGVFLLHEQANIYTILSFCAIMCSVFLVKKGYQQQQVEHALAVQASETK